ncbi:hypothetical protein Bca4012_029426 [Brassica carinata]
MLAWVISIVFALVLRLAILILSVCLGFVDVYVQRLSGRRCSLSCELSILYLNQNDSLVVYGLWLQVRSQDFGGQLSCSRIRRQAEGNCQSCHQMRYWVLGLVTTSIASG